MVGLPLLCPAGVVWGLGLRLLLVISKPAAVLWGLPRGFEAGVIVVTDRVRRGWVRPIGVLPVPEPTTVVLNGTSLFRVCPLPVPELLLAAVCGLDREVFTVLAKVVGLTVELLVVAVVVLVAVVVVDIFDAGTTADADVDFEQGAILELPGFTAELVDDALVFDVVVDELTLDLIVVDVVVVPTVVLLFRLVVGTVGPGLLATFDWAAPDTLGPAFGLSVEISILAAVAKHPDPAVVTFPFSSVATAVELGGLFLSEVVDKLVEVLALFLSKRPTLPLSIPALTRDRLFFELTTFSSFFLGFFSTVVSCDVSCFTVSLSVLSSVFD